MLAVCMEDIPRQEMVDKFKASQPKSDPEKRPLKGSTWMLSGMTASMP